MNENYIFAVRSIPGPRGCLAMSDCVTISIFCEHASGATDYNSSFIPLIFCLPLQKANRLKRQRCLNANPMKERRIITTMPTKARSASLDQLGSDDARGAIEPMGFIRILCFPNQNCLLTQGRKLDAGKDIQCGQEVTERCAEQRMWPLDSAV